VIENPDNDFHGYPRYKEIDHENIKDCVRFLCNELDCLRDRVKSLERGNDY
jgi:hypothetical protein